MIVEFILLIFTFSPEGGVASQRITFANAQECETAKSRVEQTSSVYYLYNKAVCIRRTTSTPIKPGVE